MSDYQAALKRIQSRVRKRIIDSCQEAICGIGDQIYRYPEIEGDPEEDEWIICSALGNRLEDHAENTLTKISNLINRTTDRVTGGNGKQDISHFAPVEWLVLLGMVDQRAAVALFESFTPAELVAMGTDAWLWTCLYYSVNRTPAAA